MPEGSIQQFSSLYVQSRKKLLQFLRYLISFKKNTADSSILQCFREICRESQPGPNDSLGFEKAEGKAVSCYGGHKTLHKIVELSSELLLGLVRGQKSQTGKITDYESICQALLRYCVYFQIVIYSVDVCSISSESSIHFQGNAAFAHQFRV